RTNWRPSARVSHMLVPVSASATGKTLMASRWARLRAKASTLAASHRLSTPASADMDSPPWGRLAIANLLGYPNAVARRGHSGLRDLHLEAPRGESRRTIVAATCDV